ncbi:MAG: glycosyltransferase [Clostridia bacterium]|nr:glycosyltransferase [Clostridia bacterium]
MKIVEVISDTNIGGAGVLLCTRLKHSDPEKFQTAVILPTDSKLKPRIEGLGRSVYEIPGKGDRSWSLEGLYGFMALFFRLRPDLVNCHGSLTGRVAATLCGIPTVVYTRHCAYPTKPWQKYKLVRAIMGICQMPFYDHVIAVADAARQNLQDLGIPKKRISVIINGVEELKKYAEEEKSAIRKKLGIPQDAFVIGICARLEACKGHKDLLEAARILLHRSRRFRFLIIGGGSLFEQLKVESRKKGIEPYVIFTDFVEDVTPYMNCMDLQVNCSVGTETSSLALSEGMSLGIPMVVSNYGGNPYMVRNGVNGYLFPAGQFEVLAEKILFLFEHPSIYQKMSKQARLRFLEELNAREMTRQTNALYRSLILSQKRKGRSQVSISPILRRRE